MVFYNTKTKIAEMKAAQSKNTIHWKEKVQSINVKGK